MGKVNLTRLPIVAKKILICLELDNLPDNTNNANLNCVFVENTLVSNDAKVRCRGDPVSAPLILWYLKLKNFANKLHSFRNI